MTESTTFEPGAPERVMLFIGNAQDGGHVLAKHLDIIECADYNPQIYVRVDLAQKAIDQIVYALRPHGLIVMVDPENNYSVGRP